MIDKKQKTDNNDIVKESLGSFKQIFQEKEDKEKTSQTHSEIIIEKKEERLLSMRMLLKKIVEAGLVVKNANYYDLTIKNLDDVEFQVYEAPSSPSWAPGKSLFIDHPARIEIAVPNDIKKEGEIIIRFSSDHPDKYKFNKRFVTSQDACRAFGVFLANNAIKIKRIKVLEDLSV